MVFISYSKSNVNQRKRLETELKMLRYEGLLARHWHAREAHRFETSGSAERRTHSVVAARRRAL